MQRFGGISRYFFEIFSRISALEDAVMNPEYNRNEYFKAVLPGKSDLCNDRQFPGKYHLRNLLEEFHLKTEIRKGSYEIIHHTGEFPMLFMHHRKIPVVVTIHDMIPEEFHDRRRIWQRRLCVKLADHIICVSEYTRQRLLSWYPDVNIDKTSVIYHGFSFPGSSQTRVVADDYILFVGNRAGYKNFETALEAMAEILKERNLKLVCAGNAFTAAEKQMVERLGLGGNVLEFGFADDSQLASLYQYAKLFIFPSRLEGFGIPVLEAMSHRCPVCLSDASCFPEIAADAADYFNPDDKSSIAASVRRVLDDSAYRDSLVEKGCRRAGEFSWDKAAAETLAVYKKVLSV